MNWVLALPLVVPLSIAMVAVVAWRFPTVQKCLGVSGALGLLLASVALFIRVRSGGVQVMEVGDWPAPFGIVLVADLFSAIMVLMAGLMGLVVVCYSLVTVDSNRTRLGYYPLLLLLLMGVCGAFLAGGIFNLYVWFEVLLIASFVLLALGGERDQMEGAIKYVVLNLLSSALFLAAVGILYGMVGTLNFADLSLKLNAADQPGLVTVVGMMFFIAFGIKAAAFPLFFWLPDSYHTPPVAVTAIFAALLTKVGVYSLIRVFTLIFVQDVGYTHTVILIVAGLTMVTGVLGAVAQYDFRRLLSFHIVSQIGYLLMGLGLFTTLSLAGSVFFMVHVILAKSALFLISGLTHRLQGTYDLKIMGGVYRSYPGLAVLFIVPALSLAGVPPLSGFFAKLALVRSGLDEGAYWIVATALVVSILTLFSMIKIWNEVFWKDRPDLTGQENATDSGVTGRAGWLIMVVPTILIAGLTVVLGFAAGPIFSISLDAAQQLLDPTEYIQAVLGG